jgi:hypothetical protein
MITKRGAALAALVLAATPTFAGDLQPQQLAPMSTQFYVSIPFDGATRSDRMPVWGFAFRGARDYQVFNLNTRILNFKLDNEGTVMGGSTFDPTVLLIGGAAAAAAVVVASKDKGVQQAQQQAQQQQQAEQDARNAAGCTQPLTQPRC